MPGRADVRPKADRDGCVVKKLASTSPARLPSHSRSPSPSDPAPSVEHALGGRFRRGGGRPPPPPLRPSGTRPADAREMQPGRRLVPVVHLLSRPEVTKCPDFTHGPALLSTEASGRCWFSQATFAGAHGNGRARRDDSGSFRPRLGTGRLGKGDSLTGREFRRLRVGCQQFRKALGIAARHAAFGGYAVDPDMAPGGGEASSVAGHVVAVNEAEIELPLCARSRNR
jgi:hypothetical protein